ncbi:MAG: crossover junction endodeoxyribonuclease RuvC [Phycisphaerales bacterium]|nr:crossover junction endodeoxyribonuclease RuvC [Phycisphaerales bacterium]
MNLKEPVIIGVDPGSEFMGIALLQVGKLKPSVILFETISLRSIKNKYERLGVIHKNMHDLLNKYKPNVLSIEAPFYSKNVKSTLTLGRVQGIIMALAIDSGIAIYEYAPRKIKKSITGRGAADKKQVWKMLKSILNLKDDPQHDDASDALAIAYCHYLQKDAHALESKALPVKNKNKKGTWKDFILANKDRLKK